MNRSARILVVSHCILNANSKVRPLAFYPGVLIRALKPFIEAGVGLMQLPCPETFHLGMRRFGMTREQYDTPGYIRACEEILSPTLVQLMAFRDAGYAFEGLVGVDGSPSCGVTQTCFGYSGGEIGAGSCDIAGQLAGLTMGPGQGVFIQVLLRLLHERGLSIPLMSINEEDPSVIRTH